MSATSGATAMRDKLMLTIWTRLPNERGSASSRWFPANFSGCGSSAIRSSVARSVASLRAAVSAADGVSAGGLPRA